MNQADFATARLAALPDVCLKGAMANDLVFAGKILATWRGRRRSQGTATSLSFFRVQVGFG